jgi:4-aminobutyrate aminotransferase-like enzyme
MFSFFATLLLFCTEASIWCVLQVAYFVNSGSEANDLALRIANCAAPGATHVAIMGGAYHGHTKAIIDLSPYKYEGPGGEGRKPYVHVLPCPDPYRLNPYLSPFTTSGGSDLLVTLEFPDHL